MITERAVMGMFYEELMRASGLSWVSAISTDPIRSDQRIEDYAWLGQVPAMQESTGQKRFSQLREVPWTVRNVLYQAGIAFPKEWILYDKTGQVEVRTGELAESVVNHWHALIAPLIVAGETGLCYDGQPFFSTTHDEGDSGVQSNLIQVSLGGLPVTTPGTPTAPSASAMGYAIFEAIQNAMSYRDDKGEPVNENYTDYLVLTGLGLMQSAMRAFSQTVVDQGESNVVLEQDGMRLRFASTPRASWTDKFAVFCTQGRQSGILRQQRIPNQSTMGYDAEGIEFVTLWDESEHWKKSGEALASVETERAAAYGDWKKATLVQLVV